jgi:protein gp37
MKEEWVRSLRDQCQSAGVAFFYKQDYQKSRKISLPELDGRQWVEFPKVSND